MLGIAGRRDPFAASGLDRREVEWRAASSVGPKTPLTGPAPEWPPEVDVGAMPRTRTAPRQGAIAGLGIPPAAVRWNRLATGIL
jgi:hypothetical protein